MIPGRDSSASRPTPAQARQFYAAGVRVWGGYIATRPDVGLYSVWDRASFQIVQGAGMRAIGFCSGWDDAAAVAELGAAWGVLPCLDDEDGIRPRGSWEQGWLDDANRVTITGLYALATPYPGGDHHAGIRAPFHIGAWYPGGVPVLTWPPGVPRPAGPTGWQYRGTYDELGVTVDAMTLDDWFAAAPAPGPRTGGGAVGFISPDVTGEPLYEVYMSGGEAYWGVFAGGAGEWTSYAGGLPSLGSPEDALDLVRADGAVTTHQSAQRLNVRAVRRDGSRWTKVMNPANHEIQQDGATVPPFGVILDWTATPAGPPEDVPGSAPDSALRAYLRESPA